MRRIRIHYAKRGPLCFIPHVEMPPLFCRAARRAGLLSSLTAGMSPHPRVVLGPPLPMGVVGLDEPADFWFEEASDEALKRWGAFFPEGLLLTRVEEIGEGLNLSRLCQAAGHRVFLRSPLPEGVVRSCLEAYYCDSLVSFRYNVEHFEATLADPNRYGPGSLVKALAEADLIEGWPDLLIVRTAVGMLDGENVVALWAGR